MVRIEGLSKSFQVKEGQLQVLRQVQFRVKRGEIFGLVGPSGAGKSTLIRCINLLEEPTEGKVFFQDTDMTELSQKELRRARRKMGMVFQHFNLLSSRTVQGNVAFPLEVAGRERPEIERRVQELLQLVGLEDRADYYPAQLSGGQKQRVGIARALANNPAVLLCDEPTSSLDPETTRSILELLKSINQKFGLTIILITHEMNV
ncbi:MAG: ATP-binding cassette domain-containing protein, partial [Halanaerobium sp.]|nr:ATP-binding cassette domain-containing protein [Halanaerobium sp.]